MHCSPLLMTYYQAVNDELGADPVEALLHFTGISAFNLLLISLCISPIAKKLKQGLLLNTWRLLGVYAFVYALAHVSSYIVFELQLDWRLVVSEVIKRPYITVGFSAFIILLLMTLTSTKAAQRKLRSNWQKLHNWVYLAAILVALHYIWSVKSAIGQPLVYWAIVFILLYFRRQKLTRPLKRWTKNTQK
ncbi:MAG: sulfoxide reductase heme-binding subunit YedZ [Paraglaciecola sp.]